MTVANGNHFKAENVFENLKNRYFGGPKFCVIFTVFLLFKLFRPRFHPLVAAAMPGMLNEFGGKESFAGGGRGMGAVQELLQARVYRAN
jgi:hypothetical protein